MGEPLLLSNHGRSIVVFLFSAIGYFHCVPIRQVPLAAVAKQAIEKPTGTEQTDMALMQRNERSSSELRLTRMSHTLRLERCGRCWQQILNVVEGQTLVFKTNWGTCGYREGSLGSISQRR